MSPIMKALLRQKNNWQISELVPAHTLGKQKVFKWAHRQARNDFLKGVEISDSEIA